MQCVDVNSRLRSPVHPSRISKYALSSSSILASLVYTTMSDERLLVQLASYNTNLQAERGLPQDLVDWLAPTLQVSNFLSQGPRAPDIVTVGFQELLPLHLGRKYFIQSTLKHIASMVAFLKLLYYRYSVLNHNNSSFWILQIRHREQKFADPLPS